MKSQSVRMPKPGELELVERELTIGEQDVLVETHRAAICDADLRAWKGMEIPDDLPDGIFEYPGHEGSGIVSDVGQKVTRFEPGDQVMLFGPNNSFATHFKTSESNLHPVPDGVSMDTASLGEPACVGIYGVYQSGVNVGESVLVAGLNFQGQIAVEGLKKSGAATVIAVDHREPRLEVALERGADVALNPEKDDVKTRIGELTEYNRRDDASGHLSGDAGVDVSFHSCGYWNPHAEEFFNLCVHNTRDEGTVVSIPDLMTPISPDLHRIHHHGMDVEFPNLMHHGPEFLERWVPRLMKPIANESLDVDSLVTETYSISEANQAMQRYNDDPQQIKITMDPVTT